jgi:hypothetical protein
MMAEISSNQRVFFVEGDARDCVFSRKFDLVYCKDLLSAYARQDTDGLVSIIKNVKNLMDASSTFVVIENAAFGDVIEDCLVGGGFKCSRVKCSSAVVCFSCKLSLEVDEKRVVDLVEMKCNSRFEAIEFVERAKSCLGDTSSSCALYSTQDLLNKALELLAEHETPREAVDGKLKDLIQSELNRLEDQCTCKVCCESRINCALLPCGHLALCFDCALDCLSHSFPCPVCREPISRVARTFQVPITKLKSAEGA